MGDSLGKIFRITNWGESHGKAIGVVIEGCPALLNLKKEDIQKELDRRRPGQSIATTARNEKDIVEILSGVFNGKTTGSPITLIIYNKDIKKKDYADLKEKYRPSHADFTMEKKYGIRDFYGGGRSSARITAANVAAGAVAKKILRKAGIEIIAYVKKIKNISANIIPENVKKKDVESSIIRCPDKKASEKILDLIKKTKQEGDSLGGIIECIIKNVPPGLGEPVFDKLDADLAKAMLSINATKGFEIGSGFKACDMLGSEHNDPFAIKDNKVVTLTNNSGGVQGGISNGMPIIFRVAFKPTSTIMKKQKTLDINNKETEIIGKGRHDPCVLPRAAPIVEAMAAIVLADHYLRQRTIKI